MKRIGLLVGALLIVMGCERANDAEPAAHGPDIVGTWEVVGELEVPFLDEVERPTYTAERHRYIFAEDSTLRIFRPRPLGPASTIFGDYSFRQDTLVIRSEFDSGYYVIEIVNDTLYLDPIDGGRPMTLFRVSDATPVDESTQPPPPGAEDGDYSPPSDLPPHEMPQN